VSEEHQKQIFQTGSDLIETKESCRVTTKKNQDHRPLFVHFAERFEEPRNQKSGQRRREAGQWKRETLEVKG